VFPVGALYFGQNSNLRSMYRYVSHYKNAVINLIIIIIIIGVRAGGGGGNGDGVVYAAIVHFVYN
jgi:hypothetical protein